MTTAAHTFAPRLGAATLLALAVALLSHGRGQAVAYTLVVNLTLDANDMALNGSCDSTPFSGLQCTLRAAIQEANAHAGADNIYFSIPGGGPHTITIGTALPAITSPVTINGFTQPGASANTNPLSAGSNAVMKVVLTGAGDYGLDLAAGATGSTVRGLVVQGFDQAGIRTTGATGGNTIAGNYIGTNAAGTAAAGNYDGIMLHSSGNTVGGPGATDRNVISGNTREGVYALAGGNTIQDNYIGTAADGSSALGNAQRGIYIQESSGNTIDGNTIAHNGRAGVEIDSHLSYDPATANRIDGGSYFSNGKIGISLAIDGSALPNDPGDSDTGANMWQNFPVLTSAASGGPSMTVVGSLNSTANSSFTIQFYSSPECDPSGYGEGKTYLDSFAGTTNGGGDLAFAEVMTPGPVGHHVTATATDAAGNTSEFSACRVIVFVNPGTPPPPTGTPSEGTAPATPTPPGQTPTPTPTATPPGQTPTPLPSGETPEPTPTPTATPPGQTPTPLPSGETPGPTPTPTATPTPPGQTPTPLPSGETAAPTPTPTPTGTPSEDRLGNSDCDGDVDSVDGLMVLRETAGLQHSAACIGMGDVDCDDDRDSVDALRILRHVAALSNPVPSGCRAIGT